MYVPEEFFFAVLLQRMIVGKLLIMNRIIQKYGQNLPRFKNGNWIGLTNEQMLEDFDYLYKTLDENYPYFEH